MIFLSVIVCITLALGLSACKGCGNNGTSERHKHNYIQTVTQPTCTMRGYTTFTCECGSSYVDDYTAALGHNLEDDKCTRCDYIRHDHIYTVTTVEADCAKGGYTQGVCDICGATYTANIVEPLGHDYVNGKCIRCKEEHDHNYIQKIVDPDCVNQGYTIFTCDCGYGYVGNYTDPTDHEYEDGKCKWCDDLKSTEGLKYILSDNGKYYICSGIGTATGNEIIIASEYNGKPVKAIGDSAFYGNEYIKKVVIPDTVTVIGNGSFDSCSRLTSIALPNGVTTIENFAFANCERLESLILPDSLISLGRYLFENCNNLKYNEYDNAKYLGNADNPYLLLAEAVSTDIVSCIIHKNTKIIYNNAFLNCALFNIEIPESVTFIGDGAFMFCSNLTNITIPDGITHIGIQAFAACSRLKYNRYGDGYYLGNAENPYVVLADVSPSSSLSSFTVQDGTKIIMDGAFSGGSSLTEIIIPYGVVYIGQTAFAFCEQLTSIILPDSVTVIDGWAFWGCSSLTSITIPASVTYIGETVFRTCYNLKIIEFTGTKEQWNDIVKGVGWDGDAGSYTIHCTDGDIVVNKEEN